MTFEHDPDLNLLTRVTDPAGNSVTYEYSSNNDLTRVSGGCAGCGGGSSMSYTYTSGDSDPNLNHDLVSKTDALGNPVLGGISTDFAYDAVGHQTRVTYPNGDAEQQFFDAAGRRTRFTRPTGDSIDYAYDAGGTGSHLRCQLFGEAVARVEGTSLAESGRVSTIDNWLGL